MKVHKEYWFQQIVLKQLRRTGLSLIFSSILASGWCQITSVPSMTPATPNVAGLVKMADTQLSHYTGQPKISFPLYTIDLPDLKLPIALTYSYNGLRVEEYPGWVGTGWTLQATGVVSRQTRGIPDERTDGYNGANKRGLTVVSFIASGADRANPTYSAFLQQAFKGKYDTEPDIFIVSAPGLSAKFFFDETQCNSTETEGTEIVKTAVVMSDENITVKGYFNYTQKYNFITGIIKKFTVTNDQGATYIFSVLEKAANLVEDADNTSAQNDYGNAWYLSSINSPFGNTINFQYKFRVLDNPPVLTEQLIIPENAQSTTRYNTTSTTEAVLERITYSGGSIDFVEQTTPRLDWNSLNWTYSRKQATEQPKALSSLKIYNQGSLLKEINFSYSYFGSNSRLRLDAFQVKNGLEVEPATQFQYQDGSFPQIGNETSLFNQDHWGFYTNEGKSTLLSPFFATVTTGASGNLPIRLKGNLRAPKHSAAGAGLLSKIIHPLGGEDIFTYEPNNFYSATNPVFVPPQGTWSGAASAATSTNFVVGQFEDRQSFSVSTATYCRLLFNLQVANCGEGVAIVRLLKLPSMETIYTYQLSRTATTQNPIVIQGPEDSEMFLLEPGQYEVVANASIETTCSVAITQKAVANIRLQTLTVSTEGGNYLAGGFRVSEISSCEGPERQCVSKYYQYTDPVNPVRSSGVLVSPPIYGHEITLMTGSGSNVISTPVVVLTGSSLTPFVGTQSNPIGYSHVVESIAPGNAQGKSTYTFTTAQQYPDDIITVYPIPGIVDHDWKRGFNLSTKVYNSNSQVIQQRDFDPFPKEVFSRKLGLKISPEIYVQGVDYTMQINDHTFSPYFYKSGRMWVTNETQISAFASGTVSVTTNNYYESSIHREVTRISTVQSNGTTKEVRLKYRDDVNAVPDLTASEKNGILAHPNKALVFEKTEAVGGVVTSVVRNYFDGVKLIKAANSNNGGPFNILFQVEKYDTKGNAVSLVASDGIRHSSIYNSVGTQIYASAINARAEDIFFQSFEEETLGFIAEGHTGSKSRLNYAFALSNLTPGKYNLTYWIKNSGKWELITTIYDVISGSVSINLSGQVDDIRFHPIQAQMTTYTYSTYGISSITNTNNVVSYFEYDTLSRLKAMKDQDMNLLKGYNYGYRRSP